MDLKKYKSELESVYENSAWIAKQLIEESGDLLNLGIEKIASKMAEIVNNSTNEKKLTLIRCHPKLEGNVCRHKLTKFSEEEQKHAGLEKSSTDEASAMEKLNDLYISKFNFPFVICVSNLDPPRIIQSMEIRIKNSLEQEQSIAISEIHKIAKLRLAKILK